MTTGTDVVLDACCLINLCAIGDLRKTLPLLGRTWHVASVAAAESIYLRVARKDGTEDRELIDLRPILDKKLLQLCNCEGEPETARYVDLARDLDDGEAMGLAVASLRGWTFASDDRKARKLAEELHTKLLSTPEIVREWAGVARGSAADLGAALLRIMTMARFKPPPGSPGADWWAKNARNR